MFTVGNQANHLMLFYGIEHTHIQGVASVFPEGVNLGFCEFVQ